ncbi:hypothetical protein [Bradyrhizobium sp. AT1]|uniref:hypothetical protein n=1 Tax=Bradyrhizobium sp. AT1 TaxID=574934 RepID=UPI0012EE79B0|nr:hypothetical protein [Bradyrhizobium sp. AT1]
MNLPKNELVTYIESFDVADRARVIFEAGLAGSYDTDDPELAALIQSAAGSGSEQSQRLGAMMPPRQRTRAEFEYERRWQRIRHHYALTKPSPWLPAMKAESEQSLEKEYGTSLPIQQGGASTVTKRIPSGPDSLSAAMARHLYEHHHEMWPHFVGPFAPPPGYKPPGAMANPFRASPPVPPKTKSPILSAGDAMKVYNAMAFSMWAHGAVMNTHLIILWADFGLDELQAARVLGLYLHEARKWLAVGMGVRVRRIRNFRRGAEMHYVWVHENDVNRGFHSHVLTNVPRELQKQFDSWSRKCLARLTKRHVHRRAFRLAPSYAKTKSDKVARHWGWFRYLMKQLDPNAMIMQRHPVKGILEWRLRDELKPWHARISSLVPQMSLAGVSHSIGAKAQQAACFRSMLSQANFAQLYSGEELEDLQNMELSRELPTMDYRSKFYFGP